MNALNPLHPNFDATVIGVVAFLVGIFLASCAYGYLYSQAATPTTWKDGGFIQFENKAYVLQEIKQEAR